MEIIGLYVISAIFAVCGVSGVVLFIWYFRQTQKRIERLKDKNSQLNIFNKQREKSFLVPADYVEINHDLLYRHFIKLQHGVNIYLDLQGFFYVSNDVATACNQFEIEAQRKEAQEREKMLNDLATNN